ncbi:1-aminocyclopropane-1-carboxylate oxidase homolog 7-like [Carex rostrata]
MRSEKSDKATEALFLGMVWYGMEFDETKTGVKGLVDSGISKIPEFFVHRQEVSLEGKWCFSNDKFKSIEHHVLASKKGPRISVATCITPALDSEKPFGPLKLLLSDKNPPLYQEFLIPDYVKTYLSKEPNTSVLSYYKI